LGTNFPDAISVYRETEKASIAPPLKEFQTRTVYIKQS